jgi:hypothetical protein
MGSKTPSTNVQAPEKSKASKTKLQEALTQAVFALGAWDLELFWSLDVGAWGFPYLHVRADCQGQEKMAG